MRTEEQLALVQRFVRLPLAQRKAFLDKLEAKGMSLAQLPIPAVSEGAQVLPLSFAQQRQWFLWQYDPASAAYHIPVALRLRGALDRQALQLAFDDLVARHASLRTRFVEAEGRADQVIDAHSSVVIEHSEGVFDRLEEAQQIAEFVEQQTARLFDLQAGPLLRVHLRTLGEGDHLLVLTAHHIITDGASMPVMVRELTALYEGRCSGQPANLPALTIQYADYSVWQRSWMEAGEQERQLAYWTKQLGGEQPVLELPFDRPRPLQRNGAGETVELVIDGSLLGPLRKLAQAQGVTTFTLLLAAFQVLLHRYSGQHDIRVGVPFANRARTELRDLIGFFVNTQVLRGEFDGLESFTDFLAQLNNTAIDAQRYQDLPFDALVEALQVERSVNVNPLFQVMFNYARGQASASGQTGSGLQIEGVEWSNRSAQFDLSLDVSETDDALHASFIYATDVFDAATLERMAEHFQNLLRSIVAEPQVRISQLPLLDATEQQQIVQSWNDTAAAYPSNQCVHELIEAQVGLTPYAEALVFGEQSLSYAQLNQRANQLAHKLREQGVGPDVLVGIAVERSIEMVVGLLAILKAGGAYVPLDPEYPQDRLAYMFEDSGIQWLLTQSHLRDALPIPDSIHSLDLDALELDGYNSANPVNFTQPTHLAYVIYTSGSTGKPKGAGNSHTALVNRLHWMQKAYVLNGSDTVLQKTPFSFDVSVWEFFWPLLTGARLAVAQPGDHRDPERLIDTNNRYNVSTLHFVPSMLQAFMGAEQVESCTSLKRIVCSGEALPADLARQTLSRLPQAGLYNLYGPTEAAIDVTHWTCRADEGISVPIGQPIDNLKTHILSSGLLPVAQGMTGELYLGGIGLARGYHQRPALTAERFIPDPFDDQGGRLYRTGDLARYQQDGVIDYAGRIDHQVKIRGLRIELGEIEARFNEHPQVQEAVVLAIDGPSGKQLAAYLVAEVSTEEQDALRQALREHLSATLPDYMVPTHLLFLDKLPLSPNGKLDRRSLPKPDASQSQQTYLAPRNELEQRLASIWQDVLGVAQVGVSDNFFELGGDSIISIQVVSRARQAGIRFTPKQLFQHQTVQQLAAVAEQGESGRLQISQAPMTGAALLLPIHQWFFDQDIPQRHHWNQALLLKPGSALDTDVLEQALQALVVHHDALRLSFTPGDTSWTAEYREVGVQIPLLWHSDVQDADALVDYCNEAQASLGLQQGPLLRAVLATLADGSQRLLLAIHHLAVDGVSWRILLEDLQTVYEQLSQGRALKLPAKTSSTRDWAEHLQRYARSAAGEQELAYWSQQLAQASGELPGANPQGSALAVHAVSAQTNLGREATRQLLQQAPAAYRTQVNDLLLTALARVVARWTGRDDVLVHLEGHGREDLFDTVDLTRSVGWFTSLFPVKLSPVDTLDGSIKQIKEQLRAIPSNGVGFGALRYLGDEPVRALLAQLPEPQIVFNYLGQFDSSFSEQTGTSPWLTPASEDSGASQSAEASIGRGLSINGQVYDGELNLTWSFSREIFDEQQIAQLAQAYSEELKALVEHCVEAQVAGITPSDVPLAGLTQLQLDVLPVPAQEIEDLYPLSPMQQGMLFHSLYEQAGGNYINQFRVDVQGLDTARFKQAWQAAVNRHDVLRANFITQFEQPLQVIRKQIDIPFVEHDWSAQADLQTSLDTWADADRQQGFDLLHSPLLRVAAIRTGNDSHHLIYTSHHILMDGWSNSQLLGEVMQAYAGVTVGHPVTRYHDYIAWLQRQDAVHSAAFWQEQLAALEEPTRLVNAIRQDKQVLGEGYGDHYQVLDTQQTRALGDFARQQRVTVNTLVQGAWLLLLQRYTGQDCVTFGATVAGRPAELKGVEQQLGLFINTLPVVASPRGEQTVGEWLVQLQAQNLLLREHEHSPLYEIQRLAGVGGEGLFDTLLVFENYPVSEALQQGAPAGLSFSATQNHEQTNYPLTLLVGRGEELSVHYSYDRSQFDGAVVRQVARNFAILLKNMVQQPTQSIATLQLLNATEQRQIVKDWNCTAANYPTEQSMHQLFQTQAALTPDATAVISGEQHLTYRQLNQRANQLARVLLGRGVGADVLVGIAVDRSLDMLVGLLGILKAGGAYVPLDPEFPQERLAYMLEHSGATLLLTQEHLLSQLPQASVDTWSLDRDWPEAESHSTDDLNVELHPDHLAYVIYTSGSTGKPKGVGVGHQALVNFLSSMATEPGLQASDRVLALTSLSFDIAGLELYLPLLVGASVILLANRQNKDPQALLRVIREAGVTTIQATPSTWRMLLEVAEPGDLQGCKVLSGGEALAPDLAERLLIEAGHVWNLYGPTETTIWSGVRYLDPGQPQPLLGKPIANTALYVSGVDIDVVPVGVAGELLIGGDGLARGYLHRADLTAERFIPDPFDQSGQGKRLYRSGDLARHLPDGALEYVGRIDHQVKIRGFRIELGEIEAKLQELEAVRESVVIDVDGPAGKQLAAYVVAADVSLVDDEQQGARRAELLQHLKEVLPDYMVPAHLLFLGKLPQTPNGKLDRKALPKPDASQSQQVYVAPRNELEQQIAEIWATVLQVEQVGIADRFFDLGGHSLLATQVISRVRHALDIEVPLRTLFEFPLLMDFARAAALGAGSSAPAIRLADRSQPLALSYAQQRQWFLWQLEPDSVAYNIPAALELKGQLDIEALRVSFEALIARHETLRTTLREEGEQVVQVIHPMTPFVLNVEEPVLSDAGALQAWVEAEVQRPFDLQNGPLLRVRLLRLAADRHVLVLTLHHIVSDGWSMSILVDELVHLYESARTGQVASLPALPIQYADYAQWQRQWMAAGEQQRQLDYWIAQLGGEQPVLELPTDRPRPAVQSYAGASLDVELSAELAQSLKHLAHSQGVTLFMLLLGSFQTLLQRYSGQNDIRVGVPIANRNRTETEGLIGFFVNTQVLKAEFSLDTTFNELLQQSKQAVLGAQSHQDLPFEQLVEALQPERTLSHSPLFQVMFNHQTQVKGKPHHLPGLTVEGLVHEQSTAQFDLTLATYEHAEGIGASLSYATALFDSITVQRLGRHWCNLLEAIVRQPQQRIAELALLDKAEQQQIVQSWNDTAAVYPSDQCVHELIEAQVNLTPNAEALVFGDQSLSYAQLNQRANQLAHKLRDQGVGPDVLVGIAVERSVEMVVGLLAILKAGGAYVPLDPEYPQDRLAYMFEDSGIQLLLTQSHLRDALPIPEAIHSLDLDTLEFDGYSTANPANLTQPAHLAYVIYTSGSTGKPKGAGNSHTALVNRLHWMQKAYGLDGSDTVLQKTPFSFDVSVWEFFWPLLTGARLAVAQPGDHRDPERLIDTINRYNVSTLHFVPSMLQAFMGAEQVESCTSLKRIVCSGEALPADLARQTLARLPQAGLYNLYGPTEAAIDVTHWTCQADEGISVPIGQPIDNLKTHILSSGLLPVAQGMTGELYLGGIGLARGYHQRPALTAERFVPDPFDQSEQGGGRLYRTGDLARYQQDGVIDYAGRIDHQVKIRGLRIELGEIEARFNEHEQVCEAVVLDIDGPNGKQLAAYLVTDVADDTQEALRQKLREHLKVTLPEFMVPTHLLFLDKLPLSPNGKLDRKALPKPDASQTQQVYVAPQTELEQQLATIWAQVLGLEQVGLTDNFFELGGHSLLVTQVISRIRQAIGGDVQLRELFEAPRLGDFAARLAEKTSTVDPIQEQLAKSLEALKRLTTEEIDELIS